MTRLILTALLGICFVYATAQPLVVNFSDAADQDPGSQVTIDVSVEDFDNLILFQFGILWDTDIASFNSITNVTGDLPQFTEDGNIGTPLNAGMSLDDGEIFTSWSLASTEPFSIPDGTVLFSVVLDIVGAECDSTQIDIGNLPPDRLIEVVDNNFNLVGAVSSGAELSIAGEECGDGGGGNEDVLCLSGSTENVLPGEKVCVEVSVKNFIDIETAQSGIVWDSLKLEYCGVDSFGLPGLNANLFNTTKVSSGELKFLWFDNTGSNPVTLDDGEVIFDVCFNALGEIGDCIDVDFVDLPEPPPLFIEFSSGGMALDYQVNSGKVNITDVPPPDPFTIEGGTVEACPGETVCVPFTTENFDDIGSAQYTMVWDTDVMSYTGQQNLNTDLPITDFNFNGVEEVPGEGISKVRFSWNASSTCMVPDGSTLYEICFEINEGAFDMTSQVELVSDPPINIEFGNCFGEALAPNEYLLVAGIVNVPSESACNPVGTCEVDVNNACFGESNGGATVGVTMDLVEPFTVVWKDAGGNGILTGDVLTGQAPGMYTMCITDSNGANCEQMFTIEENPEIVITPIVTDAMCGQNGSVDIEVTGGVPDLLVTLDPPGDINDLPPNTYTITVEDAADCIATVEFTVEDIEPEDIVISQETMDACEGEEGMVDISVSGGCDPSCTVEVDGVDIPCDETTMLPPGNYTISVKDESGDITQPLDINEFTFNISSENIGPESESGANDGFINLSVSSECQNPEFSWTGPNFSAQTMNIANLEAGTYTVTVMCDNGCSQSMDFVVPSLDDPCSTFSSLEVISASCFGLSGEECDGAIIGTLTANCMDPTFSINGEPETDELNTTGLCAGEYTIQVFDGGVFAFDTAVTVEQGAQLVANPVITDATELGDDGAINLNISGGTAPYTVDWNQEGVEGENPTGLSPGLYSAIITDANGCDIIVQSLRVDDETEVETPCFEAINIITPNADGANDSFIINCAPATNNRLQVFDRWGRLVYGTTNYGNNWQGIDNDGNLLDEGAYMWVLEVELDIADTRIFRGTLTVLREL